jgi:glycosyltransferase involved in cell wall biosynthesis
MLRSTVVAAVDRTAQGLQWIDLPTVPIGTNREWFPRSRMSPRERGWMERTRSLGNPVHAADTASAGVTVVIPTRNRLDLLREAVASIEQQTHPDWRVLIVDDASEDGTWSWIDAHPDERVTGIHVAERAERSAARNRGLRELQTPYVLFLDDDDRLRPDGLARLASALGRDPAAVAAVGALEYFDGNGRRLAGEHPRRAFTRDVWQELVFEWVAETGRTLFRAEAVVEAGGFSESLVMGEDRDLLLRLARLGPVAFIPDTVLDHRVHPDQWRPADAAQLERQITRSHLATLDTDQQRLGERIMSARTEYVAARASWSAGRPRDALRAWLRMRSAPLRLLTSPVLEADRSRLMRAVAGAVLGERAMRASRELRSGRTGPDADQQLFQPKARVGGPSHGPDVSVIITTHNRLDLMEQAVASVRGQTFRSFELIVVDDASDDGTPAWIEAEPDIRAIHLETPSERSIARNAGAEVARGRYVMFLDDDDRLRPDALQRLTSALEAYPDALVAVGSYEQFDDDQHRAPAPHPRRTMVRNVWNEVVFGWVGHQGRALFHASPLRETGGFVSGLEPAEDRDLWLRLARLGPVVLIPDVVMDRRVHSGNHPNPDWEAFALDVVRRRLPDLPQREQRLGRRIVDARVHYSEGLRRLAAGQPITAAREFVKLARAPLGMLTSPLFRQQMRSHLGRLATSAVRRGRGTDRDA